jgi:hypothetical protein
VSTFQRIFVIEDVAAIHRLFLEGFRAARTADAAQRNAGLPPVARATLIELQKAYDQFNRELRGLSVKTARDSETYMKAVFDATRVRANSQLQPHLRSLLRSRPVQVFGGGIETGAVGVGNEDLLDQAINPTAPQYGPYWRAQEFGTGQAGVPSQVDRVIRGYFYGPGLVGPERPLAQYKGGGGPHPIFVSAKNAGAAYGDVGFSGGGGKGGGKGGFGTIEKEITPRHFIRDGADRALVEWRRGVARIGSDTVSRLRRALRP